MTGEGARHGGLVFRAGGALTFAPVSAVVKLVVMPKVARVPGAPPSLLGVALVDGEAIPVVALGTSRAHMLVCIYLGERLGLVGIESLASGTFPADPTSPEGVRYEGASVPALDLAKVYSSLQRSPWS